MVLVTVHATFMFLEMFLNMLVVMNVTAMGVMTIMLFHVVLNVLVMMFVSVFHL